MKRIRANVGAPDLPVIRASLNLAVTGKETSAAMRTVDPADNQHGDQLLL